MKFRISAIGYGCEWWAFCSSSYIPLGFFHVLHLSALTGICFSLYDHWQWPSTNRIQSIWSVHWIFFLLNNQEKYSNFSKIYPKCFAVFSIFDEGFTFILIVIIII